MYPSVFLQPRRIDKTLSAFLASVRLGPGVRADVTLQVRPLFENLGADRASNFVGHKTTPDGKQKTCYVWYQQGLLIFYRVPAFKSQIVIFLFSIFKMLSSIEYQIIDYYSTIIFSRCSISA